MAALLLLVPPSVPSVLLSALLAASCFLSANVSNVSLTHYLSFLKQFLSSCGPVLISFGPDGILLYNS